MFLSFFNLPSENSTSQLFVSRKSSPSRQSDAASIETQNVCSYVLGPILIGTDTVPLI